MVALGKAEGLPELPEIEVRLLRAPNISLLAEALSENLRRETLKRLALTCAQ
jgi:hypothetical protein